MRVRVPHLPPSFSQTRTITGLRVLLSTATVLFSTMLFGIKAKATSKQQCSLVAFE
ncbi:MAG: hypothetical protein H9535_18225 [Ignavibacteria bacterium]|nr:hypothetical protein [Ignavibacteria bacterium]